jgi:FkbM family methyltransferase
VNERLVFDVGLHTGQDTDFYLKKGFDVVAVEANPALAERARERFRDAIAGGRLVIHEVAIADRDGETDFYVNDRHDDWGTTSKAFAERNLRLGTQNALIRVRCTPFREILRRHDVPYYLKVDIEGADSLCLEALRASEERPRYVSVEASLASREEAEAQLALLGALGYGGFKIVNQAANKRVRCPDPPREGAFVDHRFDDTSSGPFGEEAPGRWVGIEAARTRYRRLLAEQRWFGAEGRLYKTLLHRLYESVKGEPAGWYDFHARLGPP